jgi:preprotein translocase subunit SecE
VHQRFIGAWRVQRQPVEPEQQEAERRNVVNSLRQYFIESWAELKKVAWPDRQTVLNLTLIVIGVSVFIGGYIAILDFGLHAALQQVLK